jgi:hypothetical protein
MYEEHQNSFSLQSTLRISSLKPREAAHERFTHQNIGVGRLSEYSVADDIPSQKERLGLAKPK